MKISYVQGAIFCLIATISWGAMFPVLTSALHSIDPFTFTAMRYAIAGAVFLLLLIRREGVIALNLKGENILLAWFLGSCGFAGFGFLVFFGQKLSGPEGTLSASIMMATMPMLGLIVNWILHRKRPPLASFAFIFLSFCGVSLVLTKGDYADIISSPSNYAADLAIILGALCWVIYTVGSTMFPKWSAYKYTTVTTLLGLTTVFVINGILIDSGTIQIPSSAEVYTIAPHLIYMALIAGVVVVLSWNLQCIGVVR